MLLVAQGLQGIQQTLGFCYFTSEASHRHPVTAIGIVPHRRPPERHSNNFPLSPPSIPPYLFFCLRSSVLSPQSVFLAVHPPGQKMRIKFLLYIYIINYIYIILYLYIYIYNKPSFVSFSTGGVIALILD